MSTTPNEPTAKKPMHDAKGRFAPGNPGGPGNPFARQVAALRQSMVNSVTPEDIQEVTQKVKQMAKEGNLQAARLLYQYCVGKPLPAPEPDKMDADEWQGYQEAVVMKEQSGAVCNAGEPEFHLKTVRVMRPIVTDMMHQRMMDVIHEPPEERARREAEDAAHCQRVVDEMRAAQKEGKGPFEEPPMTNASKRRRRPSTNDDNGEEAPSTNAVKRPRSKPLSPDHAGNGRFVVG